MISGAGPCNAERIAHRRRAHEDGAWVREAASAFARATKEPGRDRAQVEQAPGSSLRDPDGRVETR